jgi:hypothetical protein
MESEEWTLVQVDVAWDCKIQHFLLGVEKYQGSIMEWVGIGPGGGNPCIQLLFNTRSQAQDYLHEFYGDDTDLDLHLINS